MPTYEYSCDACGASVERWQRFNDSPLSQCPECGGRLQRVFSPPPVIFKGSGWYCKDSRSKPKSECDSCASKPETETAKT